MTSPLYLTFDDGPDPEWTPQVIEALERHKAQATFFVLGWRVREQPGLVHTIERAGHRVELHGDAHFDHEIATAEQLASDTRAVLGALNAEGVTPQWWRIPWGRIGPHTQALADQHRLRIVGWDADTHDWRGDGWPAQPERVRAAAERGGVVLMHDALGPGVPRADCHNTLELVHRILDAAERVETEALALPDASTTEFFTTEPGPESTEQFDVLDDFELDSAAVSQRNITQ